MPPVLDVLVFAVLLFAVLVHIRQLRPRGLRIGHRISNLIEMTQSLCAHGLSSHFDVSLSS